MDSRQFAEELIGFRRKAQQGPPSVIDGNFTGDQPKPFQPIHQARGAVRLEDKALGHEAHGCPLRAGAPYSKQTLMLLRRQPNRCRLGLAECLKSADRMPKYGKRGIIGIRELFVFVTQRSVSD